jgi:hypothetical protein
MDKSQIVTSIIVPLLGLVVLFSYYLCFFRLVSPTHSYTEHPFWYGMKSSHIKVCILFQLMAALGFLLLFFYLVRSSTSELDGLFGYLQGFAPLLILVLFLLGSITWPYCIVHDLVIGAVGSLIVVAGASICLLAGCAEAHAPVWALLGALFLCIVTVLQDAVMWNAMYIRSKTGS